MALLLLFLNDAAAAFRVEVFCMVGKAGDGVHSQIMKNLNCALSGAVEVILCPSQGGWSLPMKQGSVDLFVHESTHSESFRLKFE